MKAYRKNKRIRTSIEVNTSVEGETIEMKVNRIVNNNEPIKDGAPIIFTERKDGVMAGYDIRTDRFDVAIDATDKIAASHAAKREARIVAMKGDSGAESAQGQATE